MEVPFFKAFLGQGNIGNIPRKYGLIRYRTSIFLGKFPLIFWAIFGRGLIEESELVGYWSIAICGQMQFRNVAGSSYGRRQEWEKNWDSNAILIAENWWKLASSASKGSISPRLQAISMRLDVSCFAPHQLTHVSLVCCLMPVIFQSRVFFPNTVMSTPD